MPKNVRLAPFEKHTIIAGLAEGLTVLHLAKELRKDKRNLACFVKKPSTTPRKDKGTIKGIFARDMQKRRRKAIREPNGTSASTFAKAGSDLMSRKNRCSVLNEMARNVKPIFGSPLNRANKENCITWAQQCIETNF